MTCLTRPVAKLFRPGGRRIRYRRLEPTTILVSNRNNYGTDNRDDDLGFRLALY
jgi:hypothetical protein